MGSYWYMGLKLHPELDWYVGVLLVHGTQTASRARLVRGVLLVHGTQTASRARLVRGVLLVHGTQTASRARLVRGGPIGTWDSNCIQS